MSNEKPIKWIGSALDDLLQFSDVVKREAGYQSSRVQNDLDPEYWKDFKMIGAGERK